MRIILQKENLDLDLNTKKKETLSSGFFDEKTLLKNRSEKYLNLIAGLDVETLSATKGMEALLDGIQEEFGTADLSKLPIGIVAKCFLGHPYEVHTIDLSITEVVDHYKIGEELPPNLEKARNLALHNAYAFIEVYLDKMIIVRPDGIVFKRCYASSNSI